MRDPEKFIQTVAREAGRAVLARFGKDGVHYMKSEHRMDAVTKADLLSEKIIMGRIKRAYPDHGIISEEAGRMNEEAEYVWIIDPIDGTLNFASGIPMFGVMICLVHKGRVILSAINCPATKEFFFAKRGAGAYLNGKRIHASKIIDFSHSVGCGPMSLRKRNVRFLRRLIAGAADEHLMISSLGSIANNACYVAAGRRDWITALAGRLHDFAPVSLVLEEAGCVVTDGRGKPWSIESKELIAANPRLHKRVLELSRGL